MANGFSGVIRDGGTFEAFAWRCARAIDHNMGCRDDASPLMGRKADTYHRDEATKARSKLIELESMSLDSAEAILKAQFEARMKDWNERCEQSRELRIRYETFLVQAKAWVPPGDGHGRFKTFMIEQIEEAIRHDCHDDDWHSQFKPTLTDPGGWIVDQITRAKEDVEYHEKKYANDVEIARVAEEWNAALAKSLGTPG